MGLFASTVIDKNHKFDIHYGWKAINAEEVEVLKAQEDPKSKFKYSYLVQVSKNQFIDGSDETGGVLRFINNAPSQQLVNCEFYVYQGITMMSFLINIWFF